MSIRKTVKAVGRKVVSTVRKVVANRVQVQKNFRTRPNNKNYYGGTGKFK